MLFQVCITPQLSFKSFELFVEMSNLPEILLGPELTIWPWTDYLALKCPFGSL